MLGIFLTTIFFVLAILTIKRPFVGVLTWLWIALMSPHRETYGFSEAIPFNLIIALLTLFAIVLSSGRFYVNTPKLTVVFILFSLSMIISSVYGLTPEYSWPYLSEFLKTMLLAQIVASTCQTAIRINAITLIVVISIGYYSVFGGVFTIVTGGEYRVYGPQWSMIADNNHMALAAVMILPLFYYLQKHFQRFIPRVIARFAMILTAIAVIGSFSRGGLLAMLAMGASLIFSVRHKLQIGLVSIIIMASFFAFMPQKWVERMETIQSMGEDRSFQQRLDSWAVDFNIAVDRPLIGGGIRAYQDSNVYFRYNKNPNSPNTKGRAAHSIYFEVLADQGFTGLLLFLAIAFYGFRCCTNVMHLTRGSPMLEWAFDLAAMLRISLIGYLVGGAALSMAHYDLFYVLVAMSVSLVSIVNSYKNHPAEAKL